MWNQPGLNCILLQLSSNGVFCPPLFVYQDTDNLRTVPKNTFYRRRLVHPTGLRDRAETPDAKSRGCCLHSQLCGESAGGMDVDNNAALQKSSHLRPRGIVLSQSQN